MALPVHLHQLVEQLFPLALAGLSDGLAEVGLENVLLILSTQLLVPELLVDPELGVCDCHSPQLNAECLRLLDHILGVVLPELFESAGVGFTLGQEEFTLELLLYFLILLKSHYYFIQELFCP